MVKIQASHLNPLQTSERWRIWAIMLRQMAVSWTFSVYLHDRQAKQSERSLHSHTVPWCWNESKGKMACVRGKLHFKTAQRDWKNVRVCLCVCLSVGVRSLKREWVHSSVYVVVSDSLCAFRCVYRGIPLQGRWRGAWPLGHSSNTETRPFPSAHSGRCLSLPLKANERSLNNRRRQVISLFKHLNLSSPLSFFHSFFLPPTPHVTFVTDYSSFTHNSPL